MCPAPNTYRGSRSIGGGPTKHWLRDLETHRCPHAGPFKGRAERLMRWPVSLWARVRGRTQPSLFGDIVMSRERDDHPINRNGYRGSGPVPTLWSNAQVFWRFPGTARAHGQWFQLDGWLGRPLPTKSSRTYSYRTLSLVGACSRQLYRSCEPG